MAAGSCLPPPRFIRGRSAASSSRARRASHHQVLPC
uniref:Uncharacterized protein n=1 Tax=Arundo donax TaxID=35708 RepID=A0A0A9B9Y0_ARUDO